MSFPTQELESKDVMELGFDMMWLGMESQAVIAMRVLGMGGMWRMPLDETGRMFIEKQFGFVAATTAAMAAAGAGKGPAQIMAAAVEPLRNRTAANAKRLGKAGMRFSVM